VTNANSNSDSAGSYDFDNDEWQLYNLEDDFSEADDQATKNPQKLKELQDLFWIEATKYNVLPLDDRLSSGPIPPCGPV
jgi:arylsulfatase